MPGGIGKDRRIEIEIDGRFVFYRTAQRSITSRANVELDETMRGCLVHVGIRQHDVVEGECDDALSAQIPGVEVTACAGTHAGRIQQGRKSIPHHNVEGGIGFCVLKPDQMIKLNARDETAKASLLKDIVFEKQLAEREWLIEKMSA